MSAGSQKQMMFSTHVIYRMRSPLLLSLLPRHGVYARGRLDEQGKADQAASLVSRLLVADITQVPATCEAIGAYRRWCDPELARIVGDSTRPTRERMRASLALLPTDANQIDALVDWAKTADPPEVLVICAQLRPWRDRLVEPLWRQLLEAGPDSRQVLPLACLLATMDPRGENWPTVAKR